MSSIKFLLVMLFSIAVAACGGGGGGGGGGPTVPGTPTTVAASPRIASAIVSFTAPVNNGGAAITGYTVTSSPGGSTASGAASPITVTGLSNGTAYTFTVVATNSAGNSAASTPSNSVVPAATATVPGAPTGATATAGNLQATVTFAAPASDGGAAITGYTVTSNPAGGVDSNAGTTGLTHTITGLSNGTAYIFTVVAANSVGNSPASTASNSVTPTVAPTVPGAPTGVAATAGNASASVTFTAPASNGGATITGYTVTSHPAGGVDSNAGTTGLTHSITGLTNGTAYTFTVVATNSVGNSPASSASNAVTPVTVPGAPTAVTGTVGNAQVTVSFTAPASNGGAAITGYTVTSSPGAITATGTASPITVTGLTNNLAYTFTVVATNSAGSSTASTPSPAVTPITGYTVPGVPTAVTATAGNTLATVTFTAPVSNGGTAITGYTVTSHPAGGVDSNAGMTGLTHTITSLTNGVAYTFTVVATNSVGNSAASTASNSATPALAPVSGAVTGAWPTGVTISVSGGTTSTQTDSNGNYSFNLSPGGYTLTPSLPGYTFSPTNIPVTVLAGSSTPITGNNFVSSAVVSSSSVSGTITYGGTQTGATFIRVHDGSCTSNCQNYAEIYLPAVTGGAYTSVPFTIRGLQPTCTGTGCNPASYVLKAFIDTLGTGIPNASNPGGASSSTFTTVAGTNNTGMSITVNNKTPTTISAPTGLSISPGNNSAFVQYNPPTDSTGKELATSYTISWGTDASTATVGGSTANFTAQGTNQTVYFLNGLTNGSWYFKMTAINVAGTATTPVTSASIGTPPGGSTVVGTVTLPTLPAGSSYTGKNMMVGVYSNSTNNVYYTTITSPATSQSYTIAGVPNGDYNNFAIVDMNGDGKIDAGDISNTGNNAAPAITVSGSSTGHNLTLSAASAAAQVNTDHRFDGTNNYYSLILGMNNGTKRVVAATLVSGANMPVPFDIGPVTNNSLWTWLGSTVPVAGDTYTFNVTYSDGTTGTLTGSVTTPASFFAQNLIAVTSGASCGGCSTTVPLFTWAAPATPPASYTYSLSLWGNGVQANWYYPNNNDMPSTQTSVLYNVDGRASPATLTTGTPGLYTWQIQVRDVNGNSASYQVLYP